MNELNLQAPINRLGYGVVGQHIAAELTHRAKTNLFHIGPLEVSNTTLAPFIHGAINNVATAKFDKPPTLKIWHQGQLLERVGNGPYFGWPIFELNKFTSQELINLSCPNYLIVCSTWAQRIIKQQDIDTLTGIVPLGVDTDIFCPKDKEYSDTYKFFSIGKIEVRKGHDFIIECFNRAFDMKDKVELHMLWHNPFLPHEKEQEWAKLYKNSKLGSKVYIESPRKTHQEVAEFIQSMDCGVFPSRAEGWNLELLESMACGKPVITTAYSAHTEFCNDDNSNLITIDRTEPALDGIWFHGQGEWAFIGERQKEQLIEWMRWCYTQNSRNNSKGLETAKQFTWNNSVSKLIAFMDKCINLN